MQGSRGNGDDGTGAGQDANGSCGGCPGKIGEKWSCEHGIVRVGVRGISTSSTGSPTALLAGFLIFVQ